MRWCEGPPQKTAWSLPIPTSNHHFLHVKFAVRWGTLLKKARDILHYQQSWVSNPYCSPLRVMDPQRVTALTPGSGRCGCGRGDSQFTWGLVSQDFVEPRGYRYFLLELYRYAYTMYMLYSYWCMYQKRSNYIIWKIQLELQLFRVYYLCEFMILQYFSEGENHGQTGTFRPPKSASYSVSTVKAAGKQLAVDDNGWNPANHLGCIKPCK